MKKLYYIKEKDLMIMTLPTAMAIDYNIKSSLENELREKTGVKNALVFEGMFEHIGIDTSIQSDKTTLSYYTADGEFYATV